MRHGLGHSASHMTLLYSREAKYRIRHLAPAWSGQSAWWLHMVILFFRDFFSMGMDGLSRTLHATPQGLQEYKSVVYIIYLYLPLPFNSTCNSDTCSLPICTMLNAMDIVIIWFERVYPVMGPTWCLWFSYSNILYPLHSVRIVFISARKASFLAEILSQSCDFCVCCFISRQQFNLNGGF